MKQLRWGRSRGQSLVEFGLVLPILLTLVGACIDVARVYFGWIDLQAATRDAVQWVATDPAYATTGGYYDDTDTANYCAAFPCTAAPSTHAATVLQREVGVTFAKDASQTTCSSPKVWAVLSAPVTEASKGASTNYPLARATVTACLPFRTLVAYPLFTQNGAWVVRTEQTYEVLVGR